MEVRGEEHLGPMRGLVEELGHRPCNAQAIEGARPPAHLVEHDERPLRQSRRITSYNVCYTKLLRIRGIARRGYQDSPQGRKMTPTIEDCIVSPST